jgi:photosystem II stability/assembly factor-like uncharacterized protein
MMRAEAMPYLLRAVVMALVLLLALQAAAQDEEPRPAYHAPEAANALALDITRAGRRYVAVGARGHVLLSEDGREWEQAEYVPVQATLTRVAFAGGRLWAVGHDSTIIHSRDLGRTWSLQNFEPGWEQPLLDVHFYDANEGVAIGAYGLYMRTRDAGETWEVLEMADLLTSEAIDWEQAAEQADTFGAGGSGTMEAFEDEPFFDEIDDFDRGCYEFMECHLNAFLELDGDRRMIAAERGYGFRSTDGGATWESFKFPYPGSMFGLVALSDGGILAFGLRGHVQRSDDFGDSWDVLEADLNSTLMGGIRLDRREVLMVGAGAARLHYDARTGAFSLDEDRLGSTFVAVHEAEDGTLIYAGEEGLSYE